MGEEEMDFSEFQIDENEIETIDFGPIDLEGGGATMEELAEKLAESFLQTIQVLAAVVSLSEKYYETSHSRFVSEKAALVAENLNMDEEDILEIKIAGLLHDLGKVGFKDIIMLKYPSELNHVDYKLYTQHPEIGMQILRKYTGFERIGEIIYQHHEKINGVGFPRNLKGNAILPGAAIIAVVDAFHEGVYRLRTERSKAGGTGVKYYSNTAFLESTKDKFSNTMTYLHSKKGILFDIKVVEAFTDIMDIDREEIGVQKVHRCDVSKLEPGMAFARDYYTSYGLLIVARGEVATDDSIRAIQRFAEYDQVPERLLVMM
ncbi:MAG: metal dependent phosphohydrolase [Ignavibacteria bacterium]|nr:metal dependent phosphohydrolase [Ignavibacteria bacterium]